MAKPVAPSSNLPRKRKLTDASTKDELPPQSESINSPKLSPVEAITYHFQLSYNEQVQHMLGVSMHHADSSKTSLQKLQMASGFSSRFHDCKPISAASLAWVPFEQVADGIVELVAAPSTFDESIYVRKGVIEVCSEDDVERECALGLSQHYYTRRLLLPDQENYAERLEAYGCGYPDELPFVVLHLQCLGFGERGLSLLDKVMNGLGYPGVRVDLDPRVEGSKLSLAPLYSGTTIRTPKGRDAQDKIPSGATSRMHNFMKLNEDVEWQILRWIPLTQPISSARDWRTQEHLGQIEAILTDCIVPNYDKARGGWVHSIDLDPSIARPIGRMLRLLPPPRPSDPVPVELSNDLNAMVDAEYAAMLRIEEEKSIGGIFGEPAVQYLKTELVQHIRVVNGGVPSLHLIKDVPKEIGEGRVTSSWTADEVGQSVALYQRIMKAVDDLASKEDRSYKVIRSLDGPVMNFWRFPKLHKWWGLLVLLTGFYLRRLRPYSIHSWSSENSRLLRSGTLATIPLELNDAGIKIQLKGPRAMKAIDSQLLSHPVIFQSMTAPKDSEFREHVGRVSKVITGPGKLDIANHLPKGHLGSTFYRRLFFRYENRRQTLVHSLSVALNRITEDLLATRERPVTQDERITLLHEIGVEFERVASVSGVRDMLDEELKRQRICDQAQGLLLGKGVDKVSVDKDEDGAEDADVVERPRKRKKLEWQYPRNNGILARGDPRSAARRTQLSEIRAVDLLAENLGMSPPLVGFDNVRPSTVEFERWFVNLASGHSLQQSINAHGRTPEGIEARRVDGRRLAAVNKEWATATREGKAGLWGGWTKAEQYEEITTLLPSLRFDLTHQLFEASQRTAICASCEEVVIGQGKNTEHRCTVDANPVKIVQETFPSYHRVLYYDDILGMQTIDSEVRSMAALKCHLEEAPATDWLVTEEDGERIYNLPFTPPNTLREVTGVVFWDTTEPKDSEINFLMAADVALREWCPGYDSLDMAERGGKTIAEGARALANANQYKFWKQTYMDRLVDAVEKGGVVGCVCLKCGDTKLEVGKTRKKIMIHAPCTRDGGEKDESAFYWFRPRKLVDLPYLIARVLLYRAVRGGGTGKEAPKKTKGKERRVSGKTFEDWQTLLEWLE